MYKKVSCTCKVVVLSTKAIVVFDVLVAVVSLDRHVPILFAHKLSPPRKPLCVYFNAEGRGKPITVTSARMVI